MLIKRRRAVINSPSMPGPFRRRIDNYTIELPSKGTDLTRSIGLDSRDLLAPLFCKFGGGKLIFITIFYVAVHR